jgi:hypothetical protein
MAEDIERLHREFHRVTLGELCFLGQREIDLPAIQGADDAVWGVAKPSEVSICVDRQSLERDFRCGPSTLIDL